MAQHEDISPLESANRAYAARVGNLDEADQQVRDEQEKAEEGFEHTETSLAEEARFVANPDELRKEVDSEEKFLPSEGAADNVDPTDVDEAAEKPAKKTAAKKTAAK